MPAGKNMFEYLWDRMDELMHEWYLGLAGNHPTWDDERRWECRGEMKGVAYAIQQFSHPFFQEDKAVSKHAYARYVAKRDEQQIPDTPGVDGYSPLPPAGAALRAVSAFKPKKKAAVTPTVSPETERQIRNGLKAGFPVKDLADIYRVPTHVVESFQ